MKTVNILLAKNDFVDFEQWERILESLDYCFGLIDHTLDKDGVPNDIPLPGKICITICAADTYRLEQSKKEVG